MLAVLILLYTFNIILIFRKQLQPCRFFKWRQEFVSMIIHKIIMIKFIPSEVSTKPYLQNSSLNSDAKWIVYSQHGVSVFEYLNITPSSCKAFYPCAVYAPRHNLPLYWSFASCFNLLERRTYGRDKGSENNCVIHDLKAPDDVNMKMYVLNE